MLGSADIFIRSFYLLFQFTSLSSEG